MSEARLKLKMPSRPWLLRGLFVFLCTLGLWAWLYAAAPWVITGLRLLVVLCAAGFFAFLAWLRDYLRRENLDPRRRLALSLAALLALTAFCELVVFNRRFFESRHYSPVALGAPVVGEGLVPNELGIYMAGEGEQTLEYRDIGAQLHNLNIQLATANPAQPIPVAIYATDGAISEYFTMPGRSLVPARAFSQYVKLHLSGPSSSLLLKLDLPKGESLLVGEVTANVPVPLQPSKQRVMVIFLVLAAGWWLRQSRLPFAPQPGEKRQTALLRAGAVCLALALQWGLVWAMVGSAPGWNTPETELGNKSYTQYYLLTQSLRRGRLHLDEEPPAWLAEMDNPYDGSARRTRSAQEAERPITDLAYYQGRYYVYYGIAPILALYLPYNLLTGQNLPHGVANGILGCLLAAAVFYLAAQLVRRYFPRLSLAGYLAGALLVLYGSGFLFLLATPTRIFEPPYLMGMVLTAAGLGLWISAKDGGRRGLRLFLGSLCMALVAACRPTQLVFSLLALPLFWDEVFKARSLFSKRSAGATLAACLPYLLVAAPLMAYNAARFGSVLDFGAAYNLSHDLTRRGFVLDRAGLGLYAYFFALPWLKPVFPYFEAVSRQNTLMGFNFLEPS